MSTEQLLRHALDCEGAERRVFSADLAQFLKLWLVTPGLEFSMLSQACTTARLGGASSTAVTGFAPAPRRDAGRFSPFHNLSFSESDEHPFLRIIRPADKTHRAARLKSRCPTPRFEPESVALSISFSQRQASP